MGRVTRHIRKTEKRKQKVHIRRIKRVGRGSALVRLPRGA